MNNSINETIVNTSVNRSGLVCYTKVVHDASKKTYSATNMCNTLGEEKSLY